MVQSIRNLRVHLILDQMSKHPRVLGIWPGPVCGLEHLSICSSLEIVLKMTYLQSNQKKLLLLRCLPRIKICMEIRNWILKIQATLRCSGNIFPLLQCRCTQPSPPLMYASSTGRWIQFHGVLCFLVLDSSTAPVVRCVNMRCFSHFALKPSSVPKKCWPCSLAETRPTLSLTKSHSNDPWSLSHRQVDVPLAKYAKGIPGEARKQGRAAGVLACSFSLLLKPSIVG